MADFTQGISGALNTLQQQAFNNQQVATRNDLLNQSTQMDLQQKQLALENEQNTQKLWNKLQGGGAPDAQEQLFTQIKQLSSSTQQDTKQLDMLREMAKVAPTPEKAIAYAKAADDAEKKAADTQHSQLESIQKTLEIGAGMATGALQADNQDSWNYYKAQAMQNGIPLPKGVTGDWAHDKPLVEAASHQVDKQKDIVAAKMEQLRIEQAAQRQKETQDYHTQSLAISRSKEALSRERLSFDKSKEGKTKATTSPTVAAQKEINRAHADFQHSYNTLAKELDNSMDPSVQANIQNRIHTLITNYKSQEQSILHAYGLPTTTKSKISNVVPTTLPSTDKSILGDKFGIH